MPELDERDERVEKVAHGLELRLRLGRLPEARVVLEEDPAELPGELERLERGAELGERRACSAGSWPVIDACALTWNVNSGGVRCAQRPVTAGSGRW